MVSNATCGISRASGANQQIDDSTRDRDTSERFGLVISEHAPILIRLTRELLYLCQRHRLRGEVAAEVKQSVFCFEQQV